MLGIVVGFESSGAVATASAAAFACAAVTITTFITFTI